MQPLIGVVRTQGAGRETGDRTRQRRHVLAHAVRVLVPVHPLREHHRAQRADAAHDARVAQDVRRRLADEALDVLLAARARQPPRVDREGRDARSRGCARRCRRAGRAAWCVSERAGGDDGGWARDAARESGRNRRPRWTMTVPGPGTTAPLPVPCDKERWSTNYACVRCHYLRNGKVWR
jgi:hypothetical protein